MQIVSLGNNLHDMSSLYYGKNKNSTVNLSSAELAQRVEKVKEIVGTFVRKNFH